MWSPVMTRPRFRVLQIGRRGRCVGGDASWGVMNCGDG